MTSPALAGTPVTSGGTSTTTPGVSLPGGSYASGDQLLILLATGDRTITTPSGWTLKKAYVDTGFCRIALYSRTSNGSESGSTVSFTASSATPYSAVAARVTGGDLSRLSASSGTDGASSTITGSALTETYDTESLYLWCAGWVDDDGNLTSYPALYPEGRSTRVSGGGTNAGAGVGFAARRFDVDTSETPGNASLDQSEAWSTFTAVLPPIPRAGNPPPTGTAGVEVDVLIDGDWVPIGDDGIYSRDPVNIKHGRSGWASTAEPSRLSFTADNRTGAWSDFYAASDVSSRLKPNTQIRAGAPQPDTFAEQIMRQSGSIDGLSTPNSSSLSITGDIDLRAEVEMLADEHSSSMYSALINKNGRYALYLGWSSGLPVVWLFWTDSGGTHSYVHSLPRHLTSRRFAIRFTLDVSTGEGISYYSDSIGGSWTQIDSSSSAGATDIATDSSRLEVFGTILTASFGRLPTRVYAIEVRDGIGGTLVADPNLTGLASGVSSFADDAGNTWTVGDDARVSATRWRFHGELSASAVRWALSGSDQWATLEAAGIQRRLRQGIDKPLQSPLRRGYDRSIYSDSVVNYWPMEEKGGSSLARFGAAKGSFPMSRLNGDASPAASDVFVCSDSLPLMGNASWSAYVDQGTSSEWMVRCLLHAPVDFADDVVILEVNAPPYLWHVQYLGSAGGNMRIFGYNFGTGTTIYDSTPVAFGIAGIPVRFSLAVENNGADLDISFLTEDFSGSAGGLTDMVAGIQVTPAYWVRLAKDQDCSDVTIGHVSVESVARSGDLAAELTGHSGETAAQRVIRLCGEEGIAVRVVGDPADSAAVGPQRPLRLIDLLDEAASTDLGILFDPAETLALGYRTGPSLYSQPPLVLDYGSGQVEGVPNVDVDDRSFRNDVTVKNWDGSTARAELTTGEFSVSEPPVGVGRYDESFEVNLADPEDLPDHAYSRLLLRTADSARLTGLRLGFNLDAVSDAIRRGFVELLPGDAVRIDGLPSTIHTDDLHQVIEGWTESIGHTIRSMDADTSAGDPWRSGLVEQVGDIRYDTAGSVLASAGDAGSTTLYVHTTDGPTWTTDGDDLPFDIKVDGVRITVSAISGSSTPQTFTVNALPRYFRGGSSVRLADPAYYTL